MDIIASTITHEKLAAKMSQPYFQVAVNLRGIP